METKLHVTLIQHLKLTLLPSIIWLLPLKKKRNSLICHNIPCIVHSYFCKKKSLNLESISDQLLTQKVTSSLQELSAGATLDNLLSEF